MTGYRPNEKLIREFIEQNGRFSPPLRNEVPFTEDLLANQFAELAEGRTRYCHTSRQWFEFDGSIWVPDRTARTRDQIRQLGRGLAADKASREILAAGRNSFVGGAEKLCQGDPRLAVTAEMWDRDRLLLGTPTGTVELRTGTLRAARPEDGITRSVRCGPAETAHCPLWLKFLDEVTGGDPEAIRLLQQWWGYGLTGLTDEHALLFVHGPGGNGKSVLVNVAAYVLGSYAEAAPMDTFCAATFDRHPTELAMLKGARVVTASETEQGRNWAESKLKLITGGDPITARHMRQDFFTYIPEFKLTVVGNYPPRLSNVDDAIRRRLLILPFSYTPDQRDTELERKLKAEAPGILRWMIDGCLDWMKNGLIRPEVITRTTESYFEEQDNVEQWIKERCDTDKFNKNKVSSNHELYESFCYFLSELGETPPSLMTLRQALIRKGFAPHRNSRMRGFRGISVNR